MARRCAQPHSLLSLPSKATSLFPAPRSYARLASAARDTLEQLLELQALLLGRAAGGAVAQPAPAANGHAPGAVAEEFGASGQLWRRLSAAHVALGPYRDTALDTWQRRTALSYGAGGGGLRALAQPVSAQVAALLREPGALAGGWRGSVWALLGARGLCGAEGLEGWRAVKEQATYGRLAAPHRHPHLRCVLPRAPAGKAIRRTQLPLSAAPRVLCEPPAAAPGPADAPDGEARDEETYDDAEFYSQLLKEFLDKGLAGGAWRDAGTIAECVDTPRLARGVCCAHGTRTDGRLLRACQAVVPEAATRRPLADGLAVGAHVPPVASPAFRADASTGVLPRVAKKRKLVDRRASKGRKLRYDVQVRTCRTA
jgi:protein AATF/BFR2